MSVVGLDQVHGKNSLSCMKVSPSDGRKLYTSSYDCTIRCLDLENQQSNEVFSIRDSDYLISNFDTTPDGHEVRNPVSHPRVSRARCKSCADRLSLSLSAASQIWATDKRGGLSHCDLREGGSRRRYEVGEGKKLGGVSVNPAQPWLVCTAGNDQHVRIWDVRHLSKIEPSSQDNYLSDPEDDVKLEPGEPIVETWPTTNLTSEDVSDYTATKAGKGLVQGNFQHGKSCSSAVWDP